MRRPFTLLILLFLFACGREADARVAPDAPRAEATGTDPRAPVAKADTLVVTDDPELREIAERLLPDLARRSGLELRAPVRLERRSRSELEGYLRAKLDEQMSPEREAGIVAAYGMLGLVPEDLDLRALLMSVYMEQVAGFYDPDSTALYVLDDQDGATLEPLLLHELVHAVQDQWADLSALTAPEVGNDRAKAAQAAIEGHATLVMLEQMTEQIQGRPVDLGEIPDFAGRIRPALEAARYQYPALAAAPRIIQESLLLPYLEGAGFVQRLWSELPEREAPFGEWLPASTEQLMDPSRLLETPVDAPTDLLVTLESGVVLHEDGLGQAELRLLLEELVGDEAAIAAQGWDGDRYVVHGTADDRGLVWVTVWDDVASRDRFLATVAGALGALPHPAAIEALEVRDRPAAALVTGARTAWSVTAVGEEGR